MSARQPFPEGGIEPGDFVNPGGMWYSDIWLEVTRVCEFGDGWWFCHAVQYTKYGTQPLEIEISYEGVRKICRGPMAAAVLKHRHQRIYAVGFRYDSLGSQTDATAKPRPRTNRD